jgi:hypothetical protein
MSIVYNYAQNEYWLFVKVLLKEKNTTSKEISLIFRQYWADCSIFFVQNVIECIIE